LNKLLPNEFFAAAPGRLPVLDDQLRYIRINQTLAEIHGLPVKDPIGRTLREVLPQLAPILQPVMQKVLTTGKPVQNFELSGETSKTPGVARYCMATYFPIARVTSEVSGIGALVVETSGFKRTQQALRESEERFRLLLENTNGGINICEARLEGECCVRKLVFYNEGFWKCQAVRSQNS